MNVVVITPSVAEVVSCSTSAVLIEVITGDPLGGTLVSIDVVGAPVGLETSEVRIDVCFILVVFVAAKVVSGTTEVVLISVLSGGRTLGDNAVGQEEGIVSVSLESDHVGGVGAVDFSVVNPSGLVTVPDTSIVLTGVSSVVLMGATCPGTLGTVSVCSGGSGVCVAIGWNQPG